MTQLALVSTRRALHAVAELVLAGPQYRAARDIRLHVWPGGFRTVAEPHLHVSGCDVVAGDRRIAIDGATARLLATAFGVEAGAPDAVYATGSGVSVDEELHVDPTAAARIEDAYELGDAALALLAPAEERVLWPEHFDVGIRSGDVNFGVSPGDGHLAEPYAYVGIDPVPADPYWNAPFGATRLMTQFADAANLRDFFVEGRDRVAAVLRRRPHR
jgi:hypothetical protein